MTEQFMKFPLGLLNDEKYKDLSLDAKVLYCLMLDRVSLSEKNGWKDEEGRTFIIYSYEEAGKMLGCQSAKTSRTFKELYDCGLIEKKKMGNTKPNIYYVNDFAGISSAKIIEASKNEFPDLSESKNGLIKNEVLDLSKSKSNHTNITIFTLTIFTLTIQPYRRN